MTSAAERLAHMWSDRARREGDQWRTRCPVHGGFTLMLRAGTRAPVVGFCFGGCDDAAIATAISSALRGCNFAPPERAPPDLNQRVERARRIWRYTTPVPGTLVETYLRWRGITLPPPPCLRFATHCRHPSGRKLPAMIAAVEIAPGTIIGVQRTYLRTDGCGKANVDPAKASLGLIQGGAVRLAEAGETLALAEGIETALSFIQFESVPCWAVLGAQFFEHVELPALPLAAQIILAIDNDAASERAADEAARRFSRQGRRIEIARPKHKKDCNDLVR